MDKDDININPTRTAMLLQRFFSAEASGEESAELESIARRHARSPIPQLPEDLDSDLRLVAALGRLGIADGDTDFPETVVPERFERRWNDAVHEAAMKSRRRPFPIISRRIMVAAASVAVLLGATMTWRFASMTDEGPVIRQKEATSRILAKATPATEAIVRKPDARKESAQSDDGVPYRVRKTEQANTVIPSDHNGTNRQAGTDRHMEPPTVVEEHAIEQRSEPLFLPAVASLPAERHNDSYLTASYAIDNATSSIADIYDVAEQSIASVAHSLESIFDGLSGDEDYTEPQTLPI